MFEECRKEGNFKLSSGRTSSYFYDIDLLLPREVATYSEYLLQSIPSDVKKKIDFIAAPAIGGIVPGFLIAFALSKPLVKVDKEGLARGPKFEAGSYLVVDDVTTSFKEANRVRQALPKSKCLGVAAYIFRGSGADLAKQDVPVFYLARKEEEEE